MALNVNLQNPGVSQCLFKLASANMNSTADQVAAPVGGIVIPAQYVLTRILVVNASISLDTAAGGVYNVASKGGTALVANSQVYSALTAATMGLELTLTATGKGLQTVAPIFALTTAQGAAATADIYFFGQVITGL